MDLLPADFTYRNVDLLLDAAHKDPADKKPKAVSTHYGAAAGLRGTARVPPGSRAAGGAA